MKPGPYHCRYEVDYHKTCPRQATVFMTRDGVKPLGLCDIHSKLVRSSKLSWTTLTRDEYEIQLVLSQ